MQYELLHTKAKCNNIDAKSTRVYDKILEGKHIDYE